MLISEFRAAWRSICSRPAHSALVVCVLALGLGSVLFVAGMINGLVLRPLPFAQPEQLFDAGLIDNDDAPDTERFDTLTVEEFLDWREYAGAVATIAGAGTRTVNLSEGERPERYSGAAVTANLFPTLGVAPALGRGFDAADEQPGAPTVVILSDAVWRTRYLADPQIVGREVRVNARPARVIGVMPPDFSYPFREQVWIPFTLQRAGGEGEVGVVIRPRAGADIGRVQTALDAWLADAMQRDPDGMRSRARAIGIQPLALRFVDSRTRALFGTMALAVGLVLLLACANASNLMLTQTMMRQQELWVRSALGASRRRLLLQLLMQSGLLAAVALLLALPLAAFTVEATERAFRMSADEGPPGWMQFGIDHRMVLIALAAAAVTALLTALLPALRAGARSERDAGARVHGGAGFARASRVLVIGEVALSCALLIGAAVLTQAIMRMQRFDIGLETSPLLTARIALFPERYPDAASLREYVRRLGAELAQQPEVESVSFSSSLPAAMANDVDVLERGLARPEAGLPNMWHAAVDADFARTAGLTLLAGRFFDRREAENGAEVIVVDETFVQRHSPVSSVLGKRFVLEGGGAAPREASVIGVVRAVQMEDVDDARQPSVFEPIANAPPRFVSVLVRTRSAPLGFADGLMRVVAAVDPDTPAYWVRGYDAILHEGMLGVHMLGRVFSGFGLVALLLAATGLYGVVAFGVAQRTREIGVRRALGAPDGAVLGAVAQRSLWQVAIGLVLGLALGIPFAGLIAAPLAHLVQVQVSAWGTVLAALAAVALFAIWLPARRALRVQPMTALRDE